MAPRKKTEDKPAAEEAERIFTEADKGEGDQTPDDDDQRHDGAEENEEGEDGPEGLATDWDDEFQDDEAEAARKGETEEAPEGDGAGAETPLRVALVDPPAEGGFAAGEVLTPGQRAGLDPLDEKKDAEEAAKRDQMTNRQTTHELDNGLDPTSRDPNAGVTPNVAYTAAATGAPPTDMSGRPPLSRDDEASLSVLRQGLTDAKSKDARDKVADDRQGWRTPADLGLSGGIVARLHGMYPNRIEVEQVPGGANFPETGKRYRLK